MENRQFKTSEGHIANSAYFHYFVKEKANTKQQDPETAVDKTPSKKAVSKTPITNSFTKSH